MRAFIATLALSTAVMSHKHKVYPDPPCFSEPDHDVMKAFVKKVNKKKSLKDVSDDMIIETGHDILKKFKHQYTIPKTT